MRERIQKRWVRVLAMCLFFVFLVLSSAASMIVQYGRNEGWFRISDGSEMGFAYTGTCSRYVSEGVNHVLDDVMWTHDPTADYLGSYMGSAFSYVIRDSLDNITADTRSDRSVYVTNASRLDEETGETYLVEGYINLPVQPYDGCYAEYALYTTFFGARYLFLAGAILFVLLAGLMFAVPSAYAVQQGKAGTLRAFQKKPFDIVLVVVIAIYLLCSMVLSERIANSIFLVFGSYVNYWMYDLYSLLWRGFRYFFKWAFAAFLVWYLCGQVGARILRKNLYAPRCWKHIPAQVFIAAGTAIHVVLLLIAIEDGNELAKLLLVLADVAAAGLLIVYMSQAKKIRFAAEKLADGHLDYTVNTGKLHFIWKALGEDLNRIGDGMAQAVEDRMRSERMKTELITNVSHDLKTPLTSIINYIDFLKSDELAPETRAEYLEILDKQSARLKKLTEDVVEASKAASGAVTVTEEPIDTVELLQQFLGEYAGRFKAARLEPVLTVPEAEIIVRADSVLLGRVIDNLITNVIKYALPGTRAYIDLWKDADQVVLTVKNISRDPLNISADELMERFVRGDSSRHSEGSGLGLSIARSLAELMGGRLSLYLDGDLFKAEIVFPAEKETNMIPHEESAAV